MKHIYIGGAGRSGTTMLGSCMMSIPGAVATPESHFKFALLDNPEEKIVDPKFLLWQVDGPVCKDDYRLALEELVVAHAKKIYPDVQNVEYWVDHTPANVLYGRELLESVPDAVFIHIIRDPRAVYSSVRDLDWGGRTPFWVASTWLKSVSAGLALERSYPSRVFTLRYEEFVRDPDVSFMDICQKLGLPSSPLSFSNYKVPAYTQHQHRKVGAAPSSSSVDAWKKSVSERDVSVIESVCRPVMALLGYTPQSEIVYGSLPLRDAALDIAKEILTRYSKAFRYKRRLRTALKQSR